MVIHFLTNLAYEKQEMRKEEKRREKGGASAV